MAWSLGGLADVARLRADYKRATGMFKEALSLYQSSGDKFGPPFSLEALGLVAAALGDAKRAARLWGAASAWREAINEPLSAGLSEGLCCLCYPGTYSTWGGSLCLRMVGGPRDVTRTGYRPGVRGINSS